MLKSGSNLFILILSRIVSTLGTGILNFSLSLYALDLTKQASAFSIVLISALTAGILINLLAGALVDKLDKKKLLILSECMLGITTLLFWFVLAYNQSILILCIFNFFATACQSLFALTLSSSIPALVKEDEVLKTNSLLQTLSTLFMVTGPVLGAFFYTLIGLKSIVLITGICNLLAGIYIIKLTFTINKEVRENVSYVKDIQNSIQYFKDKKIMRFFLLNAFLINGIYLPMLLLVIPFVTYQLFKVSGFQLSLIEGSFALGSTIGAIYIGRKKDFSNYIQKLFAFLAFQSLLVLLWIFPVFLGKDVNLTFMTGTFCFLLMITGIINMIQNIPVFSYFQTSTPIAIRAKVLGFINVALLISTPIGISILGNLLDTVPWYYVIMLCGGLLLTISLISHNHNTFKEFITELKQPALIEPIIK